MLDSHSGIGSLLGEAHSDFLRSFEDHKVFCAEVDTSHWPHFLQHPMWTDLGQIDAACPGAVEVTRGGLAQYRMQGVAPSHCVEDLNLAVRLPGLRTKLPGADAWVGALERELGLHKGIATLSAFVNPAGVGLGTHCDPCEHLLIHVAGEKLIRIAPNPGGDFVTVSHALPHTPKHHEYVQYPDGLPDWNAVPHGSREIRLRPGSVLLLPRGVYHETIGGPAGPCATVVVQFNLRSYADYLLDYLKPYLRQDPRWRAPVLGACDPERRDTVDKKMEALLTELGAKLPSFPGAAVRDNQAHDQLPLRGDTRVMRNPAISVTFEGEGVRITPHRGRGLCAHFKLGPDAVTAIRDLLQTTRPTTCGQLAHRFDDWEEDSLFELLRFLVRKQVLVVLAVEPYVAREPDGDAKRLDASSPQSAGVRATT